MKVLLATSGGIDSMTMADILFSHNRLCTLDCESIGIAHCNFHLRPGDCDLDEELVRSWAAERDIPFYSISFDTLGYAGEKGVSIEMAARELRYRWFASICHEHGYDAVATAHHADDNAETLMLNLMRGTGMRGICGMTAEDRLPYQEDGGNIRLLRPMLGLTRADIEKYAQEHDVPYRTDCTNAENDCRRNRIRNQVFPIMKEMNPSFIRTVNEDMAHFRQASGILDQWFREHRWIVRAEEGRESIALKDLLATDGWEYLLWRWLDGKGFNSSTITGVENAIKSGDSTFSGKSFIEGEWQLITASGSLVLSRTCAQMRIMVEERDYDGVEPLEFEAGTLLMDADRLGEWERRNWQEGDWFVPFGMKGRKKLSDWFTDTHTDLASKQEATVIARPGENHIAAVLTRKAARQDDSLRVSGETRHLLVVKVVSDRK